MSGRFSNLSVPTKKEKSLLDRDKNERLVTNQEEVEQAANEVLADVSNQTAKESNESAESKKKTNAGRPALYKDTEMKKISALIDIDLNMILKGTLSSRGLKKRGIIAEYIENWIENPTDFKYEYDPTKTRKSNGILVEAHIKEAFSDKVKEMGMTQTYVLESLFEKILEDYPRR